MEVAAVLGLVEEVHGVRACPSALREDLVAASRSVARLRSWVDASAAELAARLAACTSFPHDELATATRTNIREVGRLLDRAGVLEQAPAFAEALDDARVTAGHVDALGRALHSLEPPQREELLERADVLAEVAETATVDEFARRLRAEARRITADDGMTRLERQRRDTRVRTWVDPATGMWCVSGRFDPETGLALAGRLENMVAVLFADESPDTCPSDPGEKQDHLRALALAALTEGKGAVSGRAEIVVVVDTTDPDPVSGAPSVDWGLPVELPMQVLHDLWGTADVHAVVVRNGIVLHAPGNLNPGRSVRVANRAQRRALRALYKTCAVPGCAVRSHHCKLHHIIWWEHGGPTNLDNLIPLCELHHHAVHDLGWQVTLGPRRELTLDLPDGTRYSTGPPQRGRESVTKTVRPTRANGPAGPGGPPGTGPGGRTGPGPARRAGPAGPA